MSPEITQVSEPGNEVVSRADGRPSEIELLVPADDIEAPELSIVIPALDEELTIVEFVQWCKQGLADAGVEGEVLIVDSSCDRTAELAIGEGARVLRVPKRGLGRAYIDALPYARGRWLLLGDADCTYDFRRLGGFVEKFREGYEYVMGSRWKGSIEKGAMPALHQYLGTPVTTFILNRLFRSKFSDIHCGMRGITRDALERMELQSQSWEYASEMVLKSVHMNLRTSEVPVRFLKDQEGRLSHHKREGWFSPWKAAWINLRAMSIYGADFFALRPGVLLLVAGVLLTVPLAGGPIEIGSTTLSLYTMLLGLLLTVIGLQGIFLGCIAQVLFDYTGDATRRWTSIFSYNRAMAAAAALATAGIAAVVPLIVEYIDRGLELGAPGATENHLAVFGATLLASGFSIFVFTLILHGAVLATHRKRK